MNKFVLIGRKLSHSYSPEIHNKFYEKYNIDAYYTLMPIEKEELKSVVDKMRSKEITGINITIPYKTDIIEFIDELSDAAKRIGAVNILHNDNGKIVGHNTDYYGFINTLKNNNIDPKGKDVYILGSGGASKASVTALEDLDANIFVVSRNPNKNEISYSDLEKVKDIYLLVNATPVGMYPKSDACPVSDEVIKKAEFVFDYIYNPLETQLLKKAKKGINGLYLLVSQALCAEGIWYEREISCTNEIEEYIKKVII